MVSSDISQYRKVKYWYKGKEKLDFSCVDGRRSKKDLGRERAILTTRDCNWKFSVKNR
jgi:hypothetical protein